MNERTRVAVVYGSGSTYDSGYTMEVTPPRYASCPITPFQIKPPTDRNFFGTPELREIVTRYRSICLFVKKYYGFDLETPAPLNLEEVWSAVDLNHKHIRLETYDWRGATGEYCRGQVYDFEDEDNCDTEEEKKSADNKIGGNEVKLLADCARHLRWLVYRVYGAPRLGGAVDNFGALHRALVERGIDVEYITFNYDSCLERSLKRSNFDFNYLSDLEVPSGPGLFRPKAPHILKLHGSLTWEHKYSKPWPITLALTHEPWDNRGDALNFLAVRPQYNRRGFLEPAIVPPTWAKQDINDDTYATDNRLAQLILHQWRAALAALQTAQAVIIAGYSFPVTDFHVQRLFRLGVMDREGNRLPILYCSGESDEQTARMRLSFLSPDRVDIRSALNGFTNLCQPATLKESLDRLLA